MLETSCLVYFVKGSTAEEVVQGRPLSSEWRR